MRKINYFWMVGILIPLFLISIYAIEDQQAHINLSLQQFIVGRWKLRGNLSRNDIIPFEFEFAPPSTLIWNFNSPDGTFYNSVYHYQFIGENKIQITGRDGDDWVIENQGNLLIIHSGHEPTQAIVYQRLPVVDWRIPVIILLFLVVASFLVAAKHLKLNKKMVKERDYKNPEYLDLYQSAVNNLIALPVFGLGLITGNIIWNLPALLLIKLPWDAIITLEMATLFLIFGITAIIVNRFTSKILTFSIKGFYYHLGVFIISYSIWGIIEGLLRLILFILYGSYAH
ncbi:MAG: hypothetical protein P4L50_07630 [Anaerolineaceae bacterium]|nr:hypothetical protein [Anaerolineaceae bacterium]